jgi:signal transduction histidine kinase
MTTMTTTTTPTRPDGRRAGERGILAPAARLDRWLDGVLLVLIVTCAIRYVSRHGLDTSAAFVLTGAVLLAAAYAARPLVRDRPGGPTAWVAVVVALWTGLTLVAPSFAWTAVPIAFAVLQVLPFRYAACVVVLMTVVVSVAWSRLTDGFDPTVVVGPVGIALVTVMAYRALAQESQRRQRLLDDLTEAQADLAAAQRRSGALAERTRLSREIHDSVGQSLSSINLLLNAADQGWERRPEEARQHVRTAAGAARDALDEVRRVVRDLAPAGLEGGTEGAEQDRADALPAALQRIADQTGHGLDVTLHVHGTPTDIPPAVASAIVRTARGSLANVVEHAAASKAAITLTYLADEVRLDVRDDGRGFDSQGVRVRGDRGRGLSGIRDRADGLGGRTEVESAPGEGTTVSVAFPLEVAR